MKFTLQKLRAWGYVRVKIS